MLILIFQSSPAFFWELLQVFRRNMFLISNFIINYAYRLKDQVEIFKRSCSHLLNRTVVGESAGEFASSVADSTLPTLCERSIALCSYANGSCNFSRASFRTSFFFNVGILCLSPCENKLAPVERRKWNYTAGRVSRMRIRQRKKCFCVDGRIDKKNSQGWGTKLYHIHIPRSAIWCRFKATKLYSNLKNYFHSFFVTNVLGSTCLSSLCESPVIQSIVLYGDTQN